MCQHRPACPAATASDGLAAHVTVAHPEQGWSLLCNGVILFEDGGVLMPSASSSGPGQPDRAAVRHAA
jgi:hypothetical protein